MKVPYILAEAIIPLTEKTKNFRKSFNFLLILILSERSGRFKFIVVSIVVSKPQLNTIENNKDLVVVSLNVDHGASLLHV